MRIYQRVDPLASDVSTIRDVLTPALIRRTPADAVTTGNLEPMHDSDLPTFLILMARAICDHEEWAMGGALHSNDTRLSTCLTLALAVSVSVSVSVQAVVGEVTQPAMSHLLKR